MNGLLRIFNSCTRYANWMITARFEANGEVLYFVPADRHAPDYKEMNEIIRSCGHSREYAPLVECMSQQDWGTLNLIAHSNASDLVSTLSIVAPSAEVAQF